MQDQLKQVIKKQQHKLDTEIGDKKTEENIIQLVGFIIGDEEYAVPILNIQEIIKPIEYTRVPKTPNYVLGAFNLRGNVIPLIDLRLKFHIPAKKHDEDTRYVVMRDGDNIAGFVIDKLTEAVRLKESQIENTPETIDKQGGVISGIGKRDKSILTILKVDTLLKRDF